MYSRRGKNPLGIRHTQIYNPAQIDLCRKASRPFAEVGKKIEVSGKVKWREGMRGGCRDRPYLAAFNVCQKGHGVVRDVKRNPGCDCNG